jgi:hypothetical protein
MRSALACKTDHLGTGGCDLCKTQLASLTDRVRVLHTTFGRKRGGLVHLIDCRAAVAKQRNRSQPSAEFAKA